MARTGCGLIRMLSYFRCMLHSELRAQQRLCFAAVVPSEPGAAATRQPPTVAQLPSTQAASRLTHMMALRGAVLCSSARHARLLAPLATPIGQVVQPRHIRCRRPSIACCHASAKAHTSINDSDIDNNGDRSSSHSSASSSGPAITLEAPPAVAAAPSRSGPSPSAALSPQQVQQLWQYLDYLLKVNKVMNLTAIRERSEAWERHIEDSLALLPVIQQHLPQSATGSISVVDVGTGAGLPGMVFAIARPKWRITLLDSLRKRCDFLDQAAVQAGVSNVHTVWCRAEDGGQQPKLRQAHDLAVARAVADTRVLAELCLPFVRQGGVWVAAKGANPQVEVAAAHNAFKQLGGRVLGVELVDSYAPEGQRTAVVVAKVMPTPRKYPRQAGTPAKKPL